MKAEPALDGSLARALVEAVPDAVLLVDGGGSITFINQRGEAIFGYARGELLGRPLETLVPVRLRRAHVAHRDAFAASPSSRPMGAGLDLVGRRKDGSEFPIEVTLSPVSLEPHLVAAVVRDVSEPRRVARTLREAEERFRVALDEAPIGMALTGLDGRFFRVNRALSKLVGYSADELTGLSFSAITHPEDAGPDLVIAGQLARGEVSHIQFGKRYLRKDGKVVSALLSVSLVRDRDDRPRYFITQVEDVTERQRSEREKEELLLWLRAVLDQCPVAIVLVKGPRGEQVEVNERAQRLVGARIDHLGQFPEVLFTPDLRPVAPENLPSTRALEGERVEWDEFQLRNVTTGLTIPVAASAAPIRDAAGRVQGAIVCFQDITPVKELERLRVEWGSIVAHDLRQPLHMIAVYSSLLLRCVGGDFEARRSVEQIRGSVVRLNRMIGDLMDLSRLEAQRLELSLEKLHIPALVHAAVERIALDASDRDLRVRIHGELPLTEIDPDRIAQVMDNLLTNAIKYSQPDTPVVIDVASREGEVSVAVTNQGQGIQRDDLPRLFHRFERSEAAKHGVKGGVGLGLYITRGLVEAHGGRITVESIPGASTTFRFTLPAA